MFLNEYQALAVRTAPTSETPHLQHLSPGNRVLISYSLVFMAAVGEYCDLLKKQIFHDHGVDRDALYLKSQEIYDAHVDLSTAILDPPSRLIVWTPNDLIYISAIFGLFGESGELASLVDRLDDINTNDEIGKELGDLLWYIAVGAYKQTWSLEEVATTNVDKLRKRYPDGFSSTDSLERRDVSLSRESASPEEKIDHSTILRGYQFRDIHGHPLETCIDYQNLLAEVEHLRKIAGETS